MGTGQQLVEMLNSTQLHRGLDTAEVQGPGTPSIGAATTSGPETSHRGAQGFGAQMLFLTAE